MKRPKLTPREANLLRALQLMKGWVVHTTEPFMSGKGQTYICLKRDLEVAEQAVSEATGGNEL